MVSVLKSCGGKENLHFTQKRSQYNNPASTAQGCELNLPQFT
ncbi:hypothetical protein [Nostoc sp.]